MDDATILVHAKFVDDISEQFQTAMTRIRTQSQAATISVGHIGQNAAQKIVPATVAFGTFRTRIREATESALTFKHAIVAAIGSHVLREFIQLVGQVQNARLSFQALTADIGVTAREALPQLRVAAKGTIADLDLMAAANKAFVLGAARSTEEVAYLIDAGRRLGKAMGRDAVQGFNDLALGLGKQQKLILDNLGITMSYESAMKSLADKLGTTTERLTEQQKKSAFMVEAHRAISERLKKLGPEMDTVSDASARLTASWDNLKNSFAEQFEVPVRASLEGIAATINYFGTLVKLLAKGEKVTEGAFLAEMAKQGHLYGLFGIPGTSGRSGKTPRGPEPVAFPDETVTTTALKDIEYKWQSAADAAREYLDAMHQARKDTMDVLEASARMAGGFQELFSGATAGLLEYSWQVSDVFGNAADAVLDSMKAMQSTISDVIFDSMMGETKSFRDYMMAMLADIGRAVADLGAKLMMAGIIKGVAGALGSAFGSVAGAMGPGPSLNEQFGSNLGGLGTASSSFGSTAHWNPSSWVPSMQGTDILPFRQFGGITNGPVIAGEAGTEAIVPLPRGRAIPVEMKGRGGSTVNNFQVAINAVDGASVQRMLYQNREYVIGLFQNAIRTKPTVRRDMRGV